MPKIHVLEINSHSHRRLSSFASRRGLHAPGVFVLYNKLLERDYSTLGKSSTAVIISNIHSWFVVKCKSL